MKAKSVCYACAGVFLLIATLELQTRGVRASAHPPPIAVSCRGANLVTEDGQVYRMTSDPWPPPTNFELVSEIPTDGRIVALRQLGSISFAVADNGDIYYPDGDGWSPVANIFDAPGAPANDGPIVDVNTQGNIDACAITAQGNAYDTGSITNWRYLGNIFGGTIAVEDNGWSGIKGIYRDEEDNQ